MEDPGKLHQFPFGGVKPHENAQPHPNQKPPKGANMQIPMQIIPFDLLEQIRANVPPVEGIDNGGKPFEGISFQGVKLMKMALTIKNEDGSESVRWTWGYPGIVTFSDLREDERIKL